MPELKPSIKYSRDTIDAILTPLIEDGKPQVRGYCHYYTNKEKTKGYSFVDVGMGLYVLQFVYDRKR